MSFLAPQTAPYMHIHQKKLQCLVCDQVTSTSSSTTAATQLGAALLRNPPAEAQWTFPKPGYFSTTDTLNQCFPKTGERDILCIQYILHMTDEVYLHLITQFLNHVGYTLFLVDATN